MAFTQTQLDTLEAAIASGATKVKYSDKEVTYGSLSDMLKLRNIMRAELGLDNSAGGRVYPQYSKGTT